MDNIKDEPVTDQTIRIQSTVSPIDRPDFYTWCKQLHVSMLHNRSDHWLDFDLDRQVLLNQKTTTEKK
jgi:hypothetical protein